MPLSEATEPLLAWYARFGRTLPWRTDRSPYRVVVSEYMLQQTQVDRVVPAFTRFVAVFESFAALAAAHTGDVVRAWRGLGYNGRAVRLQALAREVCAAFGGDLPPDQDALRRLPGVGPYTASAIGAFAFDRDEVAIDTNVRRIVQRVQFGLEIPMPASQRAIDAAAPALLVTGRANEINSALMDLGSSICTARAPKCLLCPLQRVCAAAPVDVASLGERVRAARRTGPASARMPFEQTTRFLRGRIVDVLRDLPPSQQISLLDLHGILASAAPGRDVAAVERAARALERDGLVRFDGDSLALPS